MANFLDIVSVKEFLKSVNIWWRYELEYDVSPTVYMYAIGIATYSQTTLFYQYAQIPLRDFPLFWPLLWFIFSADVSVLFSYSFCHPSKLIISRASGMARLIMSSLVAVCLSPSLCVRVCLCVIISCEQNIFKSYVRILMKFLEWLVMAKGSIDYISVAIRKFFINTLGLLVFTTMTTL